ncbi:MAG: hypothetical protein WCL30_03135 [Pseudomonadota bacterium]
MKIAIKYFAAVILLLFAASCTDIIQVQKDYISDRDECRSQSYGSLNMYSLSGASALSEKEKTATQDEVFCECMKKRDWKVGEWARQGLCRKPAPKPDFPVYPQPAPQPYPSAPTIVVVQPPQAVIQGNAPAQYQPQAR